MRCGSLHLERSLPGSRHLTSVLPPFSPPGEIPVMCGDARGETNRDKSSAALVPNLPRASECSNERSSDSCAAPPQQAAPQTTTIGRRTHTVHGRTLGGKHNVTRNTPHSSHSARGLCGLQRSTTTDGPHET